MKFLTVRRGKHFDDMKLLYINKKQMIKNEKDNRDFGG